MKEHSEALVACTDCKHKFGRWRMRCPACGTSNAQRASLNDAVNQFYVKDARVKAQQQSPRHENTRAVDECIFCRQPKADAVCDTCREPIHSRCAHLHSQLCGDFVAEVEKETARVAPSPSRSALENTSSLADAINQSLRRKD